MTDPNLTAIAVVLDRSRSMARIRAAAESGLNEFLDDQRAQPGRATLTLVEFDHGYELVHLNKPLHEVGPITLQPRGTTALLDAIGRTIADLGAALAALSEDERPGKVLVAIVTDGQENASQEFTREQVFGLVTQQRQQWNWEFVFLAANQDAIATGTHLGIDPGAAVNFAATNQGAGHMARSLSSYATSYRSTGQGDFGAGPPAD